jgi:hypothetical protein
MVYTNAGAQITIVTNGNLILNNTIIQSCDTMWRGIEVNNEARLRVLNNSFIRDADIGITAHAGATITVDSSSILDCIRGIYNAPVSSGFVNISLAVSRSVIAKASAAFKPDYIGQPAHGTLPFAGMEVNNIVMTLGGSTGKVNEFYKLNNGLVAHNSIISVKRTRFQHIGKDAYYTGQYQGMAMAADANTTSLAKLNVLPEAFAYNAVDNAEYGIYAKGVTLNVNYVHLLNVRTGVEETNAPMASTNTVSYCIITAVHIGIKMVGNPFARFMYATNNDITINGGSTSGFSLANYGLWMSEGNAVTNVRYMASDNIVNISNTLHGIYAGALNTAKIKYNTVKLNGSGSGISVFANRNTSISCNNVKGNYSTGSIGSSNGITSGNTNNKVTVYCNTVDSTFRGFNFGGANPNTVFRGNEMNTHYVGLYLNTGSPSNPTYMGIQPHHGNKWNLPTVSGFGGMNLTLVQYVQLSRFDVDGTTLGTVYYPVVTPPTWFRDTTGNTFYCYSSTVCSTPPPSLSDTTINELIATGAFDSEEISNEARAIAEEYLYRELADDSALWVNDSTYIQFMLENQNENTGYLYSVEEYMRGAYNYDSTLTALLDSCNLQIALLTDSIEKLYELGMDDLAEQVVYAIGFLNQTINNINIQREAILTNNLENADLQNDYVVDGEIPEINAAYINEIEIEYLEGGNDIQFLIDNYSIILAVAMQCPFAGGSAVERARTFIALINDSIFYDDANICLQSGIYRFAKNSIKNIEQNKILIQPNPAKDKVEINLLGNFDDGVCKVEIRNFIGEMILTDEMNCIEKHRVINLSKLSQGVYSIRVNANNIELMQKLVIIK